MARNAGYPSIQHGWGAAKEPVSCPTVALLPRVLFRFSTRWSRLGVGRGLRPTLHRFGFSLIGRTLISLEQTNCRQCPSHALPGLYAPFADRQASHWQGPCPKSGSPSGPDPTGVSMDEFVAWGSANPLVTKPYNQAPNGLVG
jgi:hypothetical protein